MQLINSFDAEIIMEYVPMGNLQDQCSITHFSTSELEEILVQSLSALVYLHGQTPPFVHRDIKPDNILMQSRAPVHIKLSDFGLSKASNSLHTFCGSPLYSAPEIFALRESDDDGSYTAAVDIWSLGATILEFGYGLPRYSKSSKLGSWWCKKLLQSLVAWEPDGVDVLYTMLVLEPERRDSARACLQRVLEDRTRRPTWTAISAQQRFDRGSYITEDEATLPHDYAAIGILPTTAPDVDDWVVQPRGHATGPMDFPNSQTDTIRPRRSLRSDAATVVEGLIWAWSSLPPTLRGATSIYETEEEAHADPRLLRTEAYRTVQKRVRSPRLNSSANTSDQQRPSQPKKAKSATGQAAADAPYA